MDVEKAEKVLKGLKEGKIVYDVIETGSPSPFAHGLVLLGEADVVLMRERRERLMELHERIMREIT